jgi:aminopeptidase N
MESAFQLDSIRNSHPIHVAVKDALDVNQIFDAISYLKGCSTLRMLVNHLGEKNFLKGVSIYLNKHAYGNAKTEALWAGLEEATGVDVDALMGNWIKKIGFPMLTVAEEPGQITVKQSRYLATGDATPEEDETVWWIPLGLQGKIGTKDVQSLALTTKEETIRDIDDDFYKLNNDGTGFYRINYPPLRLAKLGTQLDKLSIDDKTSILGSAAALASSGHGTTPALLSFLQGFGNEKSQVVWSQVLDSLTFVTGIFDEDETIKAGLQNFILKLIGPAVEHIGWEASAGEDYQAGLLRQRLLLNAVTNSHPA